MAEEGDGGQGRTDEWVDRADGRCGRGASRWNFVAGWPTKWTGPSFNATSNEVAIETLEIAHEGIEKA
jgi:phage tail-like protein